MSSGNYLHILPHPGASLMRLAIVQLHTSSANARKHGLTIATMPSALVCAYFGITANALRLLRESIVNKVSHVAPCQLDR